jgi:hypothetical protein
MHETFSVQSAQRLYNATLVGRQTRDLNLAVVKLTTVQMIRQPLQHQICKMDMICPAKPVLTEDLCIVQKEKFFYNVLYV